MTKRAQRRWLALLAGALLLCSAGAVALPYSSWTNVSNAPPSRPPMPERDLVSDRAQPLAKTLTAQDFQSYWARPLRRPLYDPPPPPPPPPVVVEVPPPRPIVAKLLATMIEPGNSMAMLRLSTGEVVFRKLEEEIGAADAGAKIASIEEGVINVERDKQMTKLVVDGKQGK